MLSSIISYPDLIKFQVISSCDVHLESTHHNFYFPKIDKLCWNLLFWVGYIHSLQIVEFRAKDIWDKVRRYWEHDGEHIGNPVRTWCNRMRTSWEHIGNNKNPTTPPSPKRKKAKAPWGGACCLTSLATRIFLACVLCHFKATSRGMNYGCIIYGLCLTLHAPNP
jgi:hypothetical protein